MTKAQIKAELRRYAYDFPLGKDLSADTIKSARPYFPYAKVAEIETWVWLYLIVAEAL